MPATSHQDELVAGRDHMIPDSALNQPHSPDTTPLAVVDQFTLNKMAQATLPKVCVVWCWERQDHVKGLLKVLHRCGTEVMCNLGDVITRDPYSRKAIDWRHV